MYNTPSPRRSSPRPALRPSTSCCLPAHGLCVCCGGQSLCWQWGIPAHTSASCGRIFTCPQSYGACASCPERCALLGTGWKELQFLCVWSKWSSLVAQLVKNLPTMWETCVWSLGWEDPLEKGMAMHFSILAWRIPWGHKESDMTQQLSLVIEI